MAKIKAGSVLKNISKGLDGILDDVASDGFENKLRKSLKDIGYVGKSSNGKNVLKFAGNNADDMANDALGKLYSIIDKNGIKNIDELNNFTGNITKGRNTIEGITRGANISGINTDTATVKSIIRNKKMNPSAMTNDEMLEVASMLRDKSDGTIPKTGGSSGQRLKGKTPEEIEEQLNRYRQNGIKMPGDKTPEEVPSMRKLKGKMYDSKDDYMRYAAARDYDDAISSFGKGEFNNPILKKLEKEGVDLKGLSKTDLKAYRDEAILNASGKDMQLMDTLGYYQVPQKATAAAGTMWLVNKLASSNGQQTNAQLYGQQSY